MPDLLLEATDVVKRYGGVAALRGASLAVRPGEVHALLGANGAGKSTLIKILTGTVRADSGTFRVGGTERAIGSAAAARAAGLASIYQDPSLIPDLTVRDNLRLTRTPVGPFRERMAELGIGGLDLDDLVRDLPLPTLRIIDLARALAIEPHVVILDETTAALPADLTERVLDVVGRQRASGRSVIFISHRLIEISTLCDRATVLRDGQTVGVVPIAPGAEDEIVALMLGPQPERAEAARATGPVAAGVAGAAVVAEARAVGRVAGTTPGAASGAADAPGPGTAAPPVPAPPSAAAPDAPPRLAAHGLRVGERVHDISLELHAGEVLGVVALEGQGQEELFEALAGARRADAGEIRVNGRPVRFGHPGDAIRAGVVLVPADRLQALLPQRSVRENIALPFSAPPSRWGRIRRAVEAPRVHAAIERLQIDTRAQGEVRRLSGGNQQKVTIARWVALGAETLLCFDPTRGIDIRTKRQIYALLRELADAGAAVLLYTSELEEIRLACDRVLVVFGGRVVDTMPAAVADEPTLLRAAYALPPGAALPVHEEAAG
ncbi:MAG: sugar ABC transporter ATP-binding protein [Chloroflexota bacterium]